jgi:hypothetical protein
MTPLCVHERGLAPGRRAPARHLDHALEVRVGLRVLPRTEWLQHAKAGAERVG